MPGSAREPLAAVAVLGDGPTGLAAAIALRRALPRCAVTVIPAPADPAALADGTPALNPRSMAFLGQLGLDETALAVRAGGAHRLGVELAGWTGPDASAVHAFGASAPPYIEAPAVSAALALAGRFAHPSDDPASPMSDVDYGLRINPAAYRRLLAGLAAHLGIACRSASFACTVGDGNGGVAQIVLADGERLAADLFFDCSGPAALLARALPPEHRVDWSDSLPVDRLLVAPPKEPPVLTPLDRIVATPLGWRAEVFGRDGVHALFAGNARLGSAEDCMAVAGFRDAQEIAIAPGRRARLWQANVVCLGDAGVQIEPLHWLNAGLAHAQIALLIELLPGRDLDPLERDEFNRRAAAMADRARDFAGLHYGGTRPPQGPFWAHAAQLTKPDSLRLTTGEFTRRGRLPFFEEDIMPRDAWVFAMAGIGLAPGPNARSVTMSPSARSALIRAQEARAQAAVRAAMPYRDWLASYLESAR